MIVDAKTTHPVAEEERAALRGLIEAHGERAVLQAIGLSRMGAYRALAGLPVTAGTRALVREGLGRPAAPRDARQLVLPSIAR